jgi:hypothetical protein
MRDRWIKTNSGGSRRERELEESGDNLLRIATEDDIEPNKEVYMQDPLNKNVFFKTYFGPSVEWQTVLEFTQTKKIYVRKEPEEEKPPPQTTLF